MLLRPTPRLGRIAVAGDSMLPTYRPGDWLLVWWVRSRRPPPPGRVVVVRRPERLVIKRVRRSFADGSVWVAGDNPSASDDSRLYGPVPVADVVGRVLCRYWRGNTPRS